MRSLEKQYISEVLMGSSITLIKSDGKRTSSPSSSSLGRGSAAASTSCCSYTFKACRSVSVRMIEGGMRAGSATSSRVGCLRKRETVSFHDSYHTDITSVHETYPASFRASQMNGFSMLSEWNKDVNSPSYSSCRIEERTKCLTLARRRRSPEEVTS